MALLELYSLVSDPNAAISAWAIERESAHFLKGIQQQHRVFAILVGGVHIFVCVDDGQR